MPYRPARWVVADDIHGLRRVKAGDYPEFAVAEFDKELCFTELPSLIEALEAGGYLRPRLDERLRTEDLKITHRLLDLLGEAIRR